MHICKQVNPFRSLILGLALNLSNIYNISLLFKSHDNKIGAGIFPSLSPLGSAPLFKRN